MPESLKTSTALSSPHHFFSEKMSYSRLMADPVLRPVNIGRVPLSVMGATMKNYITSEAFNLMTFVPPETEAIRFYVLNHLFSMIPMMKGFNSEKVLPDDVQEIAKEYIGNLRLISVRAFYYLMLIINREMRHGNNTSTTIYSWSEHKDHHAELKEYYEVLTSGGSPEEKLKGNGLNTPTGVWTEFIKWGFTNMGFGGGFGGKPWANISDCASKFVNGKISAEIMADTIWTLAHNNGPIFNKGMLYNHQNNTVLLRILDVQRAGMLPNLVMENDEHIKKFVPVELKSVIEKAQDVFKTTFDPVDWEQVMALGAVGNYGSEYTKKTGVPKTKSKTVKTPSVVLVPKLKDEVDFFVMPGLSVKKHSLERSPA